MHRVFRMDDKGPTGHRTIRRDTLRGWQHSPEHQHINTDTGCIHRMRIRLSKQGPTGHRTIRRDTLRGWQHSPEHQHINTDTGCIHRMRIRLSKRRI